MSGYRSYEPAVPHGPTCQCDNCRKQWVTTDGQLTSLERVSWLEKQVLEINRRLDIMNKGLDMSGEALWCKTGNHAFDGNDPRKKRLTTDELDKDGEPTGRDVTYYVCSEHVDQLFVPRKRSLAELRAEIEAAEEIGE